MGVEYIQSQKCWLSEPLQIKFTSLGQAILQKLNECCKTNADRILEVHHESGSQLTVRDAICQTITVAKNLMRIGVKEGDIVVLFSKSNTKITPISFACYAIGAPVSFFDINLNDDLTSYAFEQLNPTVIIFEDEFRAHILKTIGLVNAPKLKHLISLDSENAAAETDKVLFKPVDDIDKFQPPDISDPANLSAMLVFTSGSTGHPKIAMHSHAMVLQGLYNGWWQLSPGNVVCIFCDLRWICTAEMTLQPVFFDVKRIYSSKRDGEFSGDLQTEVIHIHGVTHFSVVPMSLLDIFKTVEEHLKDVSFLSSLKCVQVVGEVVPKHLLRRAARIIPDCKVINCYGMTELPGMVVSNESVDKRDINGGVLKNGFFLKIIDEQGNSLGPNEKGRLCIKSELPILGYLKNEHANKLAFLEGGWFDTQDYASMDEDNLLNIATRSKFLVRSSGKTVVPSEIEDIVHSHEDVYASALIGHPDPANQINEIATIFIVLGCQGISNRFETEIRNILKSKLTSDQLQIVKFLKIIPEMPLALGAKINRKVLKKMATEEFLNFIRL